MASGGKSYYAAQAAASSSSGSDPAPGWKAAVSLLMIAAQRARQWREAEGLLDDNDFAYAYTDYDQVVGLAGSSRCLMTGSRREQGWRRNSLQRGPKSLRTTLRVQWSGQEHQRGSAEEGQRPRIHVHWDGLLQACRHPHRCSPMPSRRNGSRPAGGLLRRSFKTPRRPPLTG